MIESARSFLPLEGETAHTLILGTMPGQASLSASRYYAHPRNAFWPIMLAIIDSQPPTHESVKHYNYDQLCKKIIDQGYAIWDVLACCDRPGSLDSRIVRNSEIPNNIAGLVKRHPELRTIACNGRTAEKLFARHINLPTCDLPSISTGALATGTTNHRLCSLPSSSPAMASLTLLEKHQLWADGLLG